MASAVKVQFQIDPASGRVPTTWSACRQADDTYWDFTNNVFTATPAAYRAPATAGNQLVQVSPTIDPMKWQVTYSTTVNTGSTGWADGAYVFTCYDSLGNPIVVSDTIYVVGGNGPTAPPAGTFTLSAGQISAIATAVNSDTTDAIPLTLNVIQSGISTLITRTPGVSQPQSGDLFALINPLIASGRFTATALSQSPTGGAFPATCPPNWLNTAAFATTTVIPRVTLVDTASALSGHTPQSGDNYGMLRPMIVSGIFTSAAVSNVPAGGGGGGGGGPTASQIADVVVPRVLANPGQPIVTDASGFVTATNGGTGGGGTGGTSLTLASGFVSAARTAPSALSFDAVGAYLTAPAGDHLGAWLRFTGSYPANQHAGVKRLITGHTVSGVAPDLVHTFTFTLPLAFAPADLDPFVIG